MGEFLRETYQVKIAINKRAVKGPYGGGNQVLNLLLDFLKKHGDSVAYDLRDIPDVILMFDSRKNSGEFNWMDIKKKYGFSIPVIYRINDNGAHREDNRDEDVIELSNMFSPKLIFVSEWVKEYYRIKGVEVVNSTVIDNATDRHLFFSKCRIRGKNEPIKLVTHHWSNNMAKGYKVYDEVSKFCLKDRRFSFRFVGNAPSNSLLNCERFPPQKFVHLPSFLQDCDAYISASAFEAGPCHVVEGMACGLIPLVKIGGGGTEAYSNGFSITFNDSSDLIEHLGLLYNDYDMFCHYKNNIDKNYVYSSTDMCQKYYDVIKEIV